LNVATLPLAVSSAVWLFFNGLRWSLFSVQSNPLFEFRLPPEYYPAKPSWPAATGQLLSWASVPYSTSRIKGPLDAGLPARYVPPSGFGYPLGGLLPSIPCRFCFAPAALVGFTLRSFLLPKGIRCVTTRMGPPTVQPAVAPAAEALGRPNRPQFLGFDPSRSPLRSDGGLARRSPDAPMGLTLLGSSGESLDRDFARSPLTHFAGPTTSRRTHRCPRVSISSRSASSAAPYLSTGNGQDDPSRVPAPARSRAFERATDRAMSSPHAVPCITAGYPALLGRFSSLYRSCPGSA
jgi:hypothetical protein